MKGAVTRRKRAWTLPARLKCQQMFYCCVFRWRVSVWFDTRISDVLYDARRLDPDLPDRDGEIGLCHLPFDPATAWCRRHGGAAAPPPPRRRAFFLCEESCGCRR